MPAFGCNNKSEDEVAHASAYVSRQTLSPGSMKCLNAACSFSRSSPLDASSVICNTECSAERPSAMVDCRPEGIQNEHRDIQGV